jgi:uncharacterized protein YlxW (UPF0749 family)
MYKNLLKNSKQELVDEIIKLREKLENKDGKINDLENEIKDLE